MKTFELEDYEYFVFNQSKTFVVIGAFDGEGHDPFFQSLIEKSNKSSCKIIFVEPMKFWFNQLQEKIQNISEFEIKCFNFAISDINKKNIMISVKPGLEWKYGPYINECSCILENWIPANYVMGDVQLKDIDFHEIESITFNQLLHLSDLKEVDFLKIDTEGFDERILKTIDFEKLNLKFLKFEKTFLSDGFIDWIYNKLEPLGFIININQDNVHFINPGRFNVL